MRTVHRLQLWGLTAAIICVRKLRHVKQIPFFYTSLAAVGFFFLIPLSLYFKKIDIFCKSMQASSDECSFLE